jgi:tRNA isopentenyl-2-thiomethyl-A-37 hydroxylase MiaE
MSNPQSVYRVMSGEVFAVIAGSEDEAIAKYYVSQGHEDASVYTDYNYDLTNLGVDVSFLEIDTTVTHRLWPKEQ